MLSHYGWGELKSPQYLVSSRTEGGRTKFLSTHHRDRGGPGVPLGVTGALCLAQYLMCIYFLFKTHEFSRIPQKIEKHLKHSKILVKRRVRRRSARSAHQPPSHPPRPPTHLTPYISCFTVTAVGVECSPNGEKTFRLEFIFEFCAV